MNRGASSGRAAVAALGIVFGDIGTSPLYTLKVVTDLAGGKPTPETALGLLSLVIWTLLITVSLKYVAFVMRADNQGEGGILALMSLLSGKRSRRIFVTSFGLFGAALLYGDGIITPAISVLSAIEGIKIVDPGVASFVVPVSSGILVALFAVQFLGTARIGWVFGPFMIAWFVVLALLGLHGIVDEPRVLLAFNPWYGLHFLLTGGSAGFLVLGGVFLAVTGAEALYADMGHFGTRPIRTAWYGLVLPALILNYAGQTGIILSGKGSGESLFYQLSPHFLLMPLIALATVATVIASQSIITGIFSMTRQAILLGWCPRLLIRQTSSESYGQIYVGSVNWILMLMTLLLTVTFGSSDRLAAAYGIAVSLTMLLTSLLLFSAMREVWGWNPVPALLVSGLFCLIDSVFFTANFSKIGEGGWVPLALAITLFLLMRIWRKGSLTVAKRMRLHAVPVANFIKRCSDSGLPRVPGVAVFLDKTTEQTPPIILWHVTHNRSLHRQVVALSVVISSIPWVQPENRLKIEKVAPEFWRIVASYGYMEKIDIPALLNQARGPSCELDLSDVTYYVGHETILHSQDGTGLPHWQEAIYSFLQKNSAHISDYFSLPRNAVVEIGRQVEI